MGSVAKSATKENEKQVRRLEEYNTILKEASALLISDALNR
jgi:hypothetical protein